MERLDGRLHGSGSEYAPLPLETKSFTRLSALVSTLFLD